MNSPTEYGSLEDCPKQVQDLCSQLCEVDGLTISNLRAVADYFNKKASDFSDIANNEVTIDEFEKAKKEPEEDITFGDADKSTTGMDTY